MLIERIIVVASLIWAAALLLWQLARAWGGGRKDYAASGGSTVKGVLYNFTAAMSPGHKEVIRNHPFKFIVGMTMHVGIGLAILKVLILLVNPKILPLAPVPLGSFLALTAAAALFLFIRRFFSPNLRKMSAFDDYLASFATLAYLTAASLHEFGLLGPGAFLLMNAAATFYIPLGKLRHVLFCPISRLDLGRRLGFRGTFPTGNSR